MRLAYFGYPHLGGTFSVYRHLRAGLTRYGHDVMWIGIGPAAERAAQDPAWQDQQDSGVAVSAHEGDGYRAAAFVRAIEEGGFDGVFVNVLADRLQTNAVRYLRHGLRIMIVHNITPATYAAARAIRDSVHATVGVSPRIRDDLVRRHGFDPEWTLAIPNATDVPPLTEAVRTGAVRPLRLLFLGRIEDQSKGVFWLPQILGRLPADVTLTVVGDGPDLERLKSRCARLPGRVRFVGSVSPGEAVALFDEHDVLIAPSRYEGFLIVLVEAMARGCVPVASQIRGVTDTIVEHGRNGLLFPVGDVAAAAREISRLAEGPAGLRRLAAHAVDTVRSRFSVEALGAGYAELIGRLAVGAPATEDALPLDRWRMARGLDAGLRTHLPLPVKNLIRTVRERGIL